MQIIASRQRSAASTRSRSTAGLFLAIPAATVTACSLTARLAALPLAVLLAPSQSWAQPGDDQLTDRLETVTVVATRTARTLDEVEATISVYTQEDVERRLVRDIQDLVRYEPGVSVGGSGSRFGLQGFTIRGVGGNRVLTMVDGIRMPEEFSFGPFLNARRDFVDVDQISRLEIARGPVSTLYGSDALGGVVAITTRAPNEYVGDDASHLEFKSGYSSEDNSFIGSATGAYGTESLAALVTYTYRQSDESETGGDVGGNGRARSEADPQDINTQSLGFKLAWSPAQGHNLIFGLDDFDSQVDTDLLSDVGVVSRGVTTDFAISEDERERRRYSLSYRYAGEGLIDSAYATAYQQQSTTEQHTLLERSGGRGGPQSRLRDSLFEQEIQGLFAQASSVFNVGASEHTLTYGIDLYRTDNENLRDGSTTDIATGAPVREFTPLPSRDFPQTEVENRALFLQDEIELLGGRLRITPGLRFDDYEATTEVDALYLGGNTEVAPPADFADSELTLKLGALYEFTDNVSGWGRYSEGFRAPPYDDVNVGFTNLVGGYKTIAAPDLEAETSTGYELGLRVNGSSGSLELALFETRYDNFIDALQPAPAFVASGGIDPSDGLRTFQSVNRDEVEIQGLELRGRYALGTLSESLAAFSLEAAVAYADGEDSEGTPIDSVDPINLVLGLTWEPAGLPLESELIWTWADEKDPDDINDAARPATDSYNVLDLLLHYDIGERWSIDAGIFNLTDETYLRWVDTAGIGQDAPDRFTRPGRNFSVTLRAQL